MTQKEATILVEIITKVVRKELGVFKKQLLQEGYTPKQTKTEPINPLTEVHRNFRKSFKSNSPSQNRRLSKDPLLNEFYQNENVIAGVFLDYCPIGSNFGIQIIDSDKRILYEKNGMKSESYPYDGWNILVGNSRLEEGIYELRGQLNGEFLSTLFRVKAVEEEK